MMLWFDTSKSGETCAARPRTSLCKRAGTQVDPPETGGSSRKPEDAPETRGCSLNSAPRLPPLKAIGVVTSSIKDSMAQRLLSLVSKTRADHFGECRASPRTGRGSTIASRSVTTPLGLGSLLQSLNLRRSGRHAEATCGIGSCLRHINHFFERSWVRFPTTPTFCPPRLTPGSRTTSGVARCFPLLPSLTILKTACPWPNPRIGITAACHSKTSSL
jgi:hypothetical protein